MRVKIGDRWHTVAEAGGICVELTDADRRNIAAMHPDGTKYAVFPDGDSRDRNAMRDWMEG